MSDTLIEMIRKLGFVGTSIRQQITIDLDANTGDGYNAKYLEYVLRGDGKTFPTFGWFTVSDTTPIVGQMITVKTRDEPSVVNWTLMYNRYFVICDRNTKWDKYILMKVTSSVTEVRVDRSGDTPAYVYYQFSAICEAVDGSAFSATSENCIVKVPDLVGRSIGPAAYTMVTPTTFTVTALVDGHLVNINSDDTSVRSGFAYWQVEQADDALGTNTETFIYGQNSLPDLIDVDPGTEKYYRVRSVSVLGDLSSWTSWTNVVYSVVPAQASWTSHIYTFDGHLVTWSHALLSSVDYFQIWRNTSASDSGATFVGTYNRNETTALISYAATGSYFGIRAVGYAGTYAATVWTTEYDGAGTVVMNVYDIPGYAVIAIDPTDTSHNLGSLAGYKVEQATDSSGTGATTLDSLRPYAGFPFQVAQVALSTRCYRLTPISVSGTEGTPTSWTCIEVTAAEGGAKDYFDNYGGSDVNDIESLYWFRVATVDSSDGWSATTGTGSVETTTKIDGGAAYKVIVAYTLIYNAIAEKTVSIDLSPTSRFDDGDYVCLAVYLSTTAPSGRVFVHFVDSSSFSYYGYVDITNTSGWNFVKIKKVNFSQYGTPDWSDITKIQIELQTSPTTGSASDYMIFDDLRIVKADPDDATAYNDTGSVWDFARFGGGDSEWHIYEGNRSGEPTKPFSLGSISSESNYHLAYVHGLDVESGTVQVGVFRKTSGYTYLTFFVDGWTFYSIGVQGANIYLRRWNNGSATLLATATFSISTNQMFWIGVDLREFQTDPGRLKVYASTTEGNLIQAANLKISHVDSSPLTAGGSAGVMTFSSNARFFDFSAGSPAHAELADIARLLDGPLTDGADPSARVYFKIDSGTLYFSADKSSWTAV